MVQTPGEYFHYCNGVSHLLSAIIQESSGMKTLEFAKKYLFDPLGIKDFDWTESPEGINNGFSGLRLHPKDMAKIGLLYLNQGKWENKQIYGLGIIVMVRISKLLQTKKSRLKMAPKHTRQILPGCGITPMR